MITYDPALCGCTVAADQARAAARRYLCLYGTVCSPGALVAPLGGTQLLRLGHPPSVLPNRRSEGGRLRQSCLYSGPQMRSAAHRLNRADPECRSRAAAVRLGHQDGRPGITPQAPSLYTLLLDPHGEAAFSLPVVDRESWMVHLRAGCEHRHQGLVEKVPHVADSEIHPHRRTIMTPRPRGVCSKVASDRSGRRTGRPFTHIECGMPKA
jgi:hypothetical protein